MFGYFRLKINYFNLEKKFWRSVIIFKFKFFSMLAVTIPFTLLLFIALFIIAIWLFHSFLVLFCLLKHFEILSLKKKNNSIANYSINQELSNINLVLPVRNDIEKGIIKKNKVLDTSSINEQHFTDIDNLFNEESDKIFSKLIKKIFNYTKGKSIKNYESHNDNGPNNKILRIIKNGVIENNCLISIMSFYRSNLLLKKPLNCVNALDILLSILIHFLLLASFSSDLSLMTVIIFTIPLILTFPMSFVLRQTKKIFFKFILNIYEQKVEKINKFELILYCLFNIIFLIFLIDLMLLSQKTFEPFFENVMIMLIPSILLDFLVMRNAILVIFFAFYSLWVKYLKKISYEQQFIDQFKEFEFNEQILEKILKILLGKEDIGVQSQNLSENLSKIYIEKKSNETINNLNIFMVNNISEFPQLNEEDEMYYFIFTFL